MFVFPAKYAKHHYGSLGKKGMIAILSVSICLLLFLLLVFTFVSVKARNQCKLNSYQTCCCGVINTFNVFKCI